MPVYLVAYACFAYLVWRSTRGREISAYTGSLRVEVDNTHETGTRPARARTFLGHAHGRFRPSVCASHLG